MTGGGVTYPVPVNESTGTTNTLEVAQRARLSATSESHNAAGHPNATRTPLNANESAVRGLFPAVLRVITHITRIARSAAPHRSTSAHRNCGAVDVLVVRSGPR